MVTSSSTLRVAPATALSGSVTPPGAKSGTVRALLAGTLASGTTTIRNAGSGDNVRAMVAACRALGAGIEELDGRRWLVHGVDHALPDEAELDAGNSGIVLRLLAAVGAVAVRCTVGTRVAASLGRRGNQELIDALQELGADAAGRGEQACPPLIVGRGAGLHGGVVSVSGRRSSQHLSGLIFLAPLLGEDVEIRMSDPLHSTSMVGTTMDTLARAGVTVDGSPDWQRYRIPGGQRYQSAEHPVASDASSVAGMLAAVAAVPGSRARIAEVAGDDGGTRALVKVMRQMGVRIDEEGDALVCHGAGDLSPIEMDGSSCMDGLLPLAALASFAEGTSVFSNVETLRHKECDRITDFLAEMATAGVRVEERRDTIIVHGTGSVRGGTQVFGHHDHAVVMAMAAVALRSREGLDISGWDAVGQTYRDFFTDLRTLGAEVANSDCGDHGPRLTSAGPAKDHRGVPFASGLASELRLTINSLGGAREATTFHRTSLI